MAMYTGTDYTGTLKKQAAEAVNSCCTFAA